MKHALSSLSPFAAAMLIQRADALFLSDLQPSDHPTAEAASVAVRAVLARCCGATACVPLVAAEYGEHPIESAARMTWALAVAGSMPLTTPVGPIPARA